MKQLSVIIPVYNGEEYVETCVTSILRQKNIDRSDIEIIIINDGSTDSSFDVVKKYELEYPGLIRLIDQRNQGAAISRNEGIKLAKGKYVTLIDQDDWIDEDYLNTLLMAIQKGNYDVLQSGFKLVDNNNIIGKVVPVKTRFGQLLAIPAWAKIYRTDFLRVNSIYFFDNNIGEDNVFTLKVYLYAETYGSIDYCGYNNYYSNSESVTNTLHKGLSPKVRFMRLLDELEIVGSSFDQDRQILEYNILRTCGYYLLSYGKYASRERFSQVAGEIALWLEDHHISPARNMYVWKKPKGEQRKAALGVKIVALITLFRCSGLFSRIYCKRTSRKEVV